MQALQKDMKEHGCQMDAITELHIVEADMESWSRLGCPADALTQAEEWFKLCAKPLPPRSLKPEDLRCCDCLVYALPCPALPCPALPCPVWRCAVLCVNEARLCLFRHRFSLMTASCCKIVQVVIVAVVQGNGDFAVSCHQYYTLIIICTQSHQAATRSGQGISCRLWQSMFIDLHGYGHWSCQLALVAGMRKLYEDSCKPDYRWPMVDMVVS